MKYNSHIQHRRSIRLRGYDYSQPGLYYITICTQNKLHLFGEIENGGMILNEYGEIAEKCLLAISEHYPHAKLCQFVIMPNHIHCIIEIIVGANIGVNFGSCVGPSNVMNIGPGLGANVGANNYSPLPTPPPSQSSLPVHGTSKTIGAIVRGFKIGVTKWFRENTDIHTVWQRNYYEQIIRDEDSYCQISEYIQTNPLKWQDDEYYD